MRALAVIAAAFGAATWIAVPVTAATVPVYVYDFDFSLNHSGEAVVDPTIAVGDTINWVWESPVPHSTTSVAGLAESWESGLHSQPFNFEYTFSQTGVFPYYCSLHGFDNGDGAASGMAGTITVIPEPAAVTIVLSALMAFCFRGLLRRRR